MYFSNKISKVRKKVSQIGALDNNIHSQFSNKVVVEKMVFPNKTCRCQPYCCLGGQFRDFKESYGRSKER